MPKGILLVVYIIKDHGGVGKVSILVPVNWVDDWVIMGVDGKAPISMDLNKIGTGTHLINSDDFNNYKLNLNWHHNPDNSNFLLSGKKGFLRLGNNNITISLLNAKNTLAIEVGIYVNDSGKIYMARNEGYSSNTKIADSNDKII